MWRGEKTPFMPLLFEFSLLAQKYRMLSVLEIKIRVNGQKSERKHLSLNILNYYARRTASFQTQQTVF